MSRIGETAVRKRRNKPTSHGGSAREHAASDHKEKSFSGIPRHRPGKAETDSDEDAKIKSKTVKDLISGINILIGLVVMVILAQKYSSHLKLLHENQMWFSSIKEVEREISFRTESGLYYSYYKQMIMAPSVLQGVKDLMSDNITEHPATINLLARMNIYQEVLLGAIYKTFPWIQKTYEAVYFYIDTVFFLQGVKLAALYLTTWLLSGTWVAGLLMSAFLVFNREDVTRVSMTIPLREHWSLPFFWIQILLLTCYLMPNISIVKQRLCVFGLFVSIFLFAVTWQFNQFILLLQTMSLFGAWLLGVIPRNKTITLYVVEILAMLLVCLLQFGNKMILTGLLISFVPAAFIVMHIEKHYLPVHSSGIWSSLCRVIIHGVLVLFLMKLFNAALKIALNEEGDEHIYKFVMAKLGSYDRRDFDVNLYLCNGAFQFIGFDIFVRLSWKLVFPIYILVHLVILIVTAANIFAIWRCKQKADGSSVTESLLQKQPQLVFNAIQAVFFGILAISTMRMKYLWTPYICILASVGLCATYFWSWLLGLFRIQSKLVINMTRHAMLLMALAVLLYIALPPALKELEELREFYDPDTVELMEWIKNDTPKSAAFTGSMQLLAGVKLCTGRRITNHPHYEDKTLRLKTRELYQMYGHRLPEDIHSILTKYKADYVILEDSICLSPRVGCRLPDIIDLANGIIPKDGPAFPGLVPSSVPLFCDEIRYGKSSYVKYFKLVFSNDTFRVYKGKALGLTSSSSVIYIFAAILLVPLISTVKLHLREDHDIKK